MSETVDYAAMAEQMLASIEPTRDAPDYAAIDTALRHRIYNATTDALRDELDSGIITKNTALLIVWELQRRGEGYRWPFKRPRQRAWNRA